MDYVKFSALKKMPQGKFLKIEQTTTMDGRIVMAVLLRWSQFTPNDRLSYFNIETGEYVGDTFEDLI